MRLPLPRLMFDLTFLLLISLTAFTTSGTYITATAATPSDITIESQLAGPDAAMLQADWLYQADGNISSNPMRLKYELKRTDAIVARLIARNNPPDLTDPLRRLESLRKQIAELPDIKCQTGEYDGRSFIRTEKKLATDGPAQYAVSIWLKTNGGVMDVTGSGLQPGDFLLVLNGGTIRIHHVSDVGHNCIDGKISVADGRWHHVVQRVADRQVSLYIDGRLDVSRPIEGKVTISGRPAFLGSCDGSTGRAQYRFRGDLARLQLIDRAPSDDEIRKLYEQELVEINQKKELPELPNLTALYIELRKIKREIFLSDPLIDFTQILMIDVPCYDALNHESMHRVFPQAQNNDGRLLVLDGIKGKGRIRDLTGQRGMFWRPDLSFDGQRVLFCMKPEGERTFHLYETSVDGGPIRQITHGLYDDLDPIYLPDGNIFFLSNRGNSYARCAVAHPSYVCSRCDKDGNNIYILSMGTEPEYTPTLLPDGRIMYTRWEYTDKELFRIQSLWTMNPDGTNVATLWGNQSYWPDMLVEARPIPGSRRIIFSGQGHHDIVHGSIGMVDPTEGFNYPDGLSRVTSDLPWAEVGNGPADKIENPDYEPAGQFGGYRCPYPLSEELFLVSAKPTHSADRGVGKWAPTESRFSLYLMDVWGNRELIYRGKNDVLYAIPVRPRKCPPAIPNRTDWPGLASEGQKAKPGVLYSNNVFEGVPDEVREKAKFVRVIHQDYTTFTFGLKCQMPDHQGVKTTRGDQHAGPPLTIASNDGIKRILGTVPIEADGSIAIEVPPSIAIHFQLLDEQYRAVHIMRSFTGVMPGEKRGCVGCHEGQGTTPSATSSIALAKGPAAPTPPPWGPRYHLGYRQDIQPILDRNCAKCHQGDGKGQETLDMTFRPSTDGGSYTEPYLTLTLGPKRRISRFAQTLCGGGVACTLLPMASGFTPTHDVTHPPLTAMSYNSLLVKNATSGKHNDLCVDPISARKLIAWVDLLCPYWNEDDIRSIPDPDPNDPFFSESRYPPRTPGVRPFADSPYPPRMMNAPMVNRAYCQEEFPSQADRLKQSDEE